MSKKTQTEWIVNSHYAASTSPIHPNIQNTILRKLPINLLIMIKKALEQLNPQSRIQIPNRRANTMHAQLRQSSIYTPDSHCTTQHWAHRASTSTIIPDLKYL